ncbi:hypothetical protein D3C84_561060 [compost metagenome]
MLEVGIVENDLRVLAAHLQLYLGLARNAADGDLPANADRTGEADTVDLVVIDDGFTDHTTTAHHQVEHAGGEASTRDDLGQGPGATGYQVGRLEHHTVAVGQGRGDFPGRNGNREVPRGDQADHAQGFTGDFHVHARAYRRQIVAGQAQAFAGEELEDVTGTAHLANGFGQGLAFLAGEQGAELFLAREDLAADFVQRIATGLDTGRRPGREGRTGRVDGGIDLGLVGLCVVADHIGQVRGVDVGLVLRASDPLAANVVVEAL